MQHEEITLKFDLILDEHDYSREELVEAIAQAVRVEIGHYLPELKEFRLWMEH